MHHFVEEGGFLGVIFRFRPHFARKTPNLAPVLTGLGKFLTENCLTTGMLKSKLASIIIIAPQKLWKIGKPGSGFPNM